MEDAGHYSFNYHGKILVKKYFEELDETNPKMSPASQLSNYSWSYSRFCPVLIKTWPAPPFCKGGARARSEEASSHSI